MKVDNDIIGSVFLMIFMIDSNNTVEGKKLIKLAIADYPNSFLDYMMFRYGDKRDSYKKLSGKQLNIYEGMILNLSKLQKKDQIEWQRTIKNKIDSIEDSNKLNDLRFEIKTKFRYTENAIHFKLENGLKAWFYLDVEGERIIRENGIVYEQIDDKIEYLKVKGELKPQIEEFEGIELSNSYFNKGIEYCLFLYELGFITHLEGKGVNDKVIKSEIIIRLFNFTKVYKVSTIIRYLTAIDNYRKAGKQPVDKITQKTIDKVNRELDRLNLR